MILMMKSSVDWGQTNIKKRLDEEMTNRFQHLLDSLPHSSSDLSSYIKPLPSSHVIHSPHHRFSSNMSYSQPMQSFSSTIALQPLRSQWSLDTDDYRIHSENHHKLYPPPHAKLSHLKSIIKWPQKSSLPTSLPYHIGDPIFFEDSFIPYAFVDFATTITVHGEKNMQWNFRLQSQPNVLFLQFNSGCIIQDDVIMPNHNTYPDGLGSKPSYAAILAVDPSSSDSFN